MKYLLLLALITGLSFVNCADDDLDSLIAQIYKPEQSSTTAAPQPVSGIPGIEPTSVSGDCICVPYYQCHADNNTINTDGIGLIDIRINDGQCSSYLDVCCKHPDVVEKTTPAPPPNKHTGCGYRNADGIGFRITGDNDNEAQYGEFPWMVAVLREEAVEGSDNKLNVYQCGSALIHPSVVLTAAHCVSGKGKKFKVRAGEWDTQTKKELYEHQDRDVKSVKIHEQFYAGALHNDVALLFLTEPVTIAENVNVICMPPHNMVVDNTRCFASGWGKDVFGKEGKYQVILKKIDLPIMKRDVCQRNLRTTRLGKFFELHKSFICAGGEEGKDTCKGDGGSPLVCPIKGGDKERYFQAGIVAWGIGCAQKDIPGVYVNIPLFRDWIDTQIKYAGYETNSYQY